VKDGHKSITADFFPRLLYPDGYIYDPNDIEKGYLHNHVLVRVSHYSIVYALLSSANLFGRSVQSIFLWAALLLCKGLVTRRAVQVLARLLG